MIKRWTKAAIECYERHFDCNGCEYQTPEEIAKEIRDEFADMCSIPRGIIEKSARELELEQDLNHFLNTSKSRELNSFEKGIKEEIERLLNGNSEVS